MNPAPVTKMGYIGVVVKLLALAAVVYSSVEDNALDSDKRVMLVAPVLASTKYLKTAINDRSRPLPILVLLAYPNPENVRLLQEAKSLSGDPELIHVKKLDDPESSANLKRQKRTLKYKGWQQKGGYQQGGCNVCGGGYGNYGGGGGGGGSAVATAYASSSSSGFGKR